MKRFATVSVIVAFSAAATVAPALATTSTTASSATNGNQVVNCLVLLFTNPKAHAEQCGVPANLPPPPSSSTGYKTCLTGEIDPFGIDGVQYRPVATTCCSSITPTQWELLPDDQLIWNVPAQRVAVAAC